MMPAIYGNAYDIVQGPGFVAIGYEMVNETARRSRSTAARISAPSMRAYMGDARGRFEGTTLVVETTNFTDKTPYRGSSERLRLVERFTPVDAGHVEWAVTFDDPATWARPWTFAMRLTKVGAERRRSNTPATKATTRCATSRHGAPRRSNAASGHAC